MKNAWSVFVCLLMMLLAGSALANDAIDSKINPQNSYLETVKSEVSSGNYDIHLYLAQSLEEEPTLLDVSTDGSDDKSPRIEISPAGDAWITWWRDLSTDEVRVRRFSHASQTFGTDRVVSDSSENARNPEIVFDGTGPFVVYEVHGASKSIIVSGIDDDPDPIPQGVTLRATSFSGNVDARIHAESGHLWVTWVDSSSDVGFSEFDHEEETWSAVSYQSYSGTTVGAARQAIRATVTGG